MIIEHYTEDGGYQFKWMGKVYEIRPDMVEALRAYVEEHRPVGDFLKAVISNNLVEAFTRADGENSQNLPAFVNFLLWEVPDMAWGSRHAYKNWISKDQGMGDQWVKDDRDDSVS